MAPDSEARIVELDAENAALREQVELLVVRVEELQARLGEDNHNSGKLPSAVFITQPLYPVVLQIGTGEGRQIEGAVRSCNPCE
jgi:hypothetical protein